MLGLGNESCLCGAAHGSAGLTGGLVGDGVREVVGANITMQAQEAKTASLTSIHVKAEAFQRDAFGGFNQGRDMI